MESMTPFLVCDFFIDRLKEQKVKFYFIFKKNDLLKKKTN